MVGENSLENSKSLFLALKSLKFILGNFELLDNDG